MGEVGAVGLDLAKNLFQAHGADAAGRLGFRKALRQGQVPALFADLPRYMVAMEACAPRITGRARSLRLGTWSV